MLPDLAPFLGALALASLVVLISNSFTKLNKIFFQATVFAAILAASLTYMIGHQDPELMSLWERFIALTFETKFCLSLVIVGSVYFGGAMYLAAPQDAEDSDNTTVTKVAPNPAKIFRTPASIDTAVTFHVPATLPVDDKVFFEEMLDK